MEGLHAQAKAKPAVYAVTEIEVKNMDAYMKEYAPKAQALIKKSGGRLVAASSSPKSIEGKAPAPRVAIQLWKDMDQYMAYRNSAELKEVQARLVQDLRARSPRVGIQTSFCSSPRASR